MTTQNAPMLSDRIAQSLQDLTGVQRVTQESYWEFRTNDAGLVQGLIGKTVITAYVETRQSKVPFFRRQVKILNNSDVIRYLRDTSNIGGIYQNDLHYFNSNVSREQLEEKCGAVDNPDLVLKNAWNSEHVQVNLESTVSSNMPPTYS